MTKLNEAAALVEQVVATLDASETVCAYCGLTRYDNRTEHQATIELQALIAKLRRWAHRLER